MSNSNLGSFKVALHQTCDKLDGLFTEWLTLLPKEFQEDVYGIPWSMISLTVVLGFVFVWVLVWRSGVTKHIQKERNLILTSEEIRDQLKTQMNAKLDQEKNLQIIQLKLVEVNYELEEEKEASLNMMGELNLLKVRLANLQRESDHEIEEINAITLKLCANDKEKTELSAELDKMNKTLEERKAAHNESEMNLNETFEELQESQKYSHQLETNVSDLQKCLDSQQKHEEEDKKKLVELEERTNDLKKQIKLFEERTSFLAEDTAAKREETTTLKDCLLQFRGIQVATVDDEDEESEDEEAINKQKEKLRSLIDVSQMQRKIKEMEAEKGRVMFELEAERRSIKDTESRFGELESACKNAKNQQHQVERELQIQETKLNVMQDFYAKREIEMQGKLGKEHAAREINESRLAEQDDKSKQLLEEVEIYKKMNDEAKKKFNESEKRRKIEINEYEKKAHSSWLESREAERKLGEANREITQLRLELRDIQMRFNDAIERDPFVFGLGPPPGSFPGPRTAYDHGSPLPFYSGPPPREGSPHMRLIGRRSPSGSIQDEILMPDRPPSHSFGERRPGSHGLPRTGSMDFNSGRMFKENDGPPTLGDIPTRERPSSVHAAPVHDFPHIREPLFLRNPGPPYNREMLPSMRFGPPPPGDRPPPFVNDIPQMMRDREISLPTADASLMMHGGGPPRGRAGPPFGHPPPPPPPPLDMRNFSSDHSRNLGESMQSGFDTSSHSTFMNKQPPPNDSLGRPPMSLHGNLPPDARIDSDGGRF